MTRAIALMALTAFASGFSLRITDPLLPQIALDFGDSVGRTSIIVTAYAVPYGFTQVFAGLIGNRFGKCEAVAGACLGSALLVILCALSRSLPQLTLARLVCAPMAAMIVPLGMTFVGDSVPYEHRQPVLARFISGQMMGMICGQIAGGIIGDHFGWRSVFVVLAVVFAVAGGALLSQIAGNAWMRRPRQVERAQRGLIAGYRLLLADGWARFILVAVFAEGLVFFGAFTYVAAQLHARFGLSFSIVGLIVAGFGVGSLLYATSVRVLVRRLRERGLVLGGGIIVALGYLTLALTPAWQAAPIAVIALGLGYYMLHNTLQTHATQMLPQARATGVAGFSSALFVGQSAGVAIAAPMVDHAGAGAVFVAAAIVWPVLAVWIVARLGAR